MHAPRQYLLELRSVGLHYRARDAVDRRFDDVNKRLGGMQWLIGVGIVTLGTPMSLYQFLT